VVAEGGEKVKGRGEGGKGSEVLGKWREWKAFWGARQKERRAEEAASGRDMALGDETWDERRDGVELRGGDGFKRGFKGCFPCAKATVEDGCAGVPRHETER
jgi:hypothetical protein